jgi:hypothetical protein
MLLIIIFGAVFGLIIFSVLRALFIPALDLQMTRPMAKGLTAREAAARVKGGKTTLCKALRPST